MNAMRIAKVGALLFALAFPPSMASAGNAYAAGSDLSIAIGCPPKPATDPEFSFTITNRGSVPVEVSPEIPISVAVHLTVKNEKGEIIPSPGYHLAGSRMPKRPLLLSPGASVTLKDWVQPDRAATTVIPLRLFGFSLPSGTYFVSATATDSPSAPISNVCTVVIP